MAFDSSCTKAIISASPWPTSKKVWTATFLGRAWTSHTLFESSRSRKLKYAVWAWLAATKTSYKGRLKFTFRYPIQRLFPRVIDQWAHLHRTSCRWWPHWNVGPNHILPLFMFLHIYQGKSTKNMPLEWSSTWQRNDLVSKKSCFCDKNWS